MNPPETNDDSNNDSHNDDGDDDDFREEPFDSSPHHVLPRGDDEPEEEETDVSDMNPVISSVPAPTSTAAATADTTNSITPYAGGCASCLPLFGRWRRRRVGGGGPHASMSDASGSSRSRSRSSSSLGLTSESRGVGHDGGIVVSAGRGKTEGDGKSARKRSWRIVGTSGRPNSSSPARICSLGGAVEEAPSSSPSSGASKVRKELKVKGKGFTIEEAGMLATRNWGGGGGVVARDVWKELVPAGGGGGKAGNAEGGTVGSGATGPAVRLRLRFVPLWDCVGVSCFLCEANIKICLDIHTNIGIIEQGVEIINIFASLKVVHFDPGCKLQGGALCCRCFGIGFVRVINTPPMV